MPRAGVQLRLNWRRASIPGLGAKSLRPNACRSVQKPRGFTYRALLPGIPISLQEANLTGVGRIERGQQSPSELTIKPGGTRFAEAACFWIPDAVIRLAIHAWSNRPRQLVEYSPTRIFWARNHRTDGFQRNSMRFRRHIDPGSYHPLHVLFWITRNLIRTCFGGRTLLTPWPPQ